MYAGDTVYSQPTRSLLFSATGTALFFVEAIRRHGGIESVQHGRRDVPFGEDACKVRQKQRATKQRAS